MWRSEGIHDYRPNQSDEGDWPGLSLEFVWLIKGLRADDILCSEKKHDLVYDICNPK